MPYHGFEVRFDNFSESSFGSGPNASIHMPTSRIRSGDLYIIDPSIRAYQRVHKKPYSIPTRIMPQSIQLGDSPVGVKLFTTSAVREFLDYIHDYVEEQRK